MLIAKDFQSVTFATVNGVGQGDVNMLVAVKHKRKTGKCHRGKKKTTAGTVLRNLGPLL